MDDLKIFLGLFIKKIVFYLCFLPFILLIIGLVTVYFEGTQGMCPFGGCPFVYGFKAVWETLFLYVAVYTFYIPILPFSLLYIIYYLAKNKKNKD